MFGIGMPELLLILAIALIVIGPKKLPDLAKSLGRALGEFKRATSDLKETLEIETDLSDVKRAFDDMNQDVQGTVDEGTGETEASSPPADEGADRADTETPVPEEPIPGEDRTIAPDEAPAVDEPPEEPDAANGTGAEQEESGRHG